MFLDIFENICKKGIWKNYLKKIYKKKQKKTVNQSVKFLKLVVNAY